MSNPGSPKLDRRKFLGTGSKLGCLVAAASLPQSAVADPTSPPNDVIVVGAGAAGLNAARLLVERGHRVVVLEATNRHGGRIFSQTLGDTRIELGAEEIYLRSNNPAYDAVTSAAGPDALVPVYVGGTSLSLDGGKRIWLESVGSENDSDIQDYLSYGSYYVNRELHQDFSITAADDVLARSGVDRNHRAYHLYENGFAGAVFGTSLEKLGAASLAIQSQCWTLSDDVRGLGPRNLGYLDVLNTAWWNQLIKLVRFNAPVAQIDRRGELIIVKQSDGTVHRARKVIVTVSIGVLQSEMIEFLPALPTSIINAYRGIGMGQGMKIALRFRRPFWGDKLGFLVHEGRSGCCWSPTSYKTGSRSHILMCYPMGNGAESLNRAGRDGEDDNEIIRITLADLDKVFRGEATPSYVDGIVQNWTADPYVLGSYSYPMKNTYSSLQESKRRDLRTPVDEQIFFAGEATNHRNPSTVPGALQEGERAAIAVDTLLRS